MFMYPNALRADPRVAGVHNGAFNAYIQPLWPDVDGVDWPTPVLSMGDYLQLATTTPVLG